MLFVHVITYVIKYILQIKRQWAQRGVVCHSSLRDWKKCLLILDRETITDQSKDVTKNQTW